MNTVLSLPSTGRTLFTKAIQPSLRPFLATRFATQMHAHKLRKLKPPNFTLRQIQSAILKSCGGITACAIVHRNSSDVQHLLNDSKTCWHILVAQPFSAFSVS